MRFGSTVTRKRQASITWNALPLMEPTLVFLGHVRVSDPFWFPLEDIVFLSNGMQQKSIQLPRCPFLFWIPHTFQDGISYALNVHDQLLTFLVFDSRQECTDKRFDCVTLFRVLKSSHGPARDALLLKCFFPPFRWAKKGHDFISDVLYTPSAELAQYFS